MTKYILDANVILQARQSHYAFEFCPAFWAWLEKMHEAGLIHSIERVRMELIAKDDDVAGWCNRIGEGFFISEGKDVRDTAKELRGHIAKNILKPSGKIFSTGEIRDFMNGADPYLIAFCKIHNCTVVKQERNKKGKIKIPAVCKSLKVDCMDIFEVLKEEKPRFILEN